MMPKLQNNLGMQGFKWFVGTVEDRDDPLRQGRVRVRAFVIHSEDTSILPTDHLPWANLSQPVTSAGHQGVGTAPLGLMKGSLVWGYFLDGDHVQIPIVCGVISGRPEGISDLPKYIHTEVVQKGTPSEGEPASEAAPQYPYNKVTVSESGHVVEIDDTPGKERLHVYHKSGSYVEIGASGNIVVKSAADTYQATTGNDSTTAKGSVSIESISGPLTLKVGGSSITINSDSIDLTSQIITINGGSNVTLKGNEIVTDGKTRLNNGSRGVVFKGSKDSRGDTNTEGSNDVLV